MTFPVSMADETIYIGLDGGGSKTELMAASTQHEELLNLFDSSANPARVGFEHSVEVLSRIIREAVRQLPGRTVASVCAGIAGAGRISDQSRIRDGIHENIPELASEHIVIVHDADIALEAAFENEGGIMVIAGTGSVALARTESGESKRVGGWGYLIGDEGSGYALGLLGMRAYAHAIDGGPETILQPRIAEEFGIHNVTDIFYRVYEEKMPLQKIAPLVARTAEEGDRVALDIVERQTRELAEQVRWLAGQCPDITQQFALLGGLVNEPFYRAALKDAIQLALGGWTFVEPLNRPVIGAWRLARRRARAIKEAGTVG